MGARQDLATQLHYDITGGLAFLTTLKDWAERETHAFEDESRDQKIFMTHAFIKNTSHTSSK